jgi:hypothetical protein
LQVRAHEADVEAAAAWGYPSLFSSRSEYFAVRENAKKKEEEVAAATEASLPLISRR